MTMTLIKTTTIGSGGASSLTFSDIPATYTDLLLLVSFRTDVGDTQSTLVTRLNGDSGANYSFIALYGTGTGIGASTGGIGSTYTGFYSTVPANSASANTFGSTSIYIPNYTGSQTKGFLGDSVREHFGSTASTQALTNNNWNSTAAINSIYLGIYTAGNLVENSTASLYGITKGP